MKLCVKEKKTPPPVRDDPVDARIIAPPRTLDAVVLSRPERVKSDHAAPPGLPNFTAGGGDKTVRGGATN